MSGAKTVVLYSFWRSSCSWRVRIALNLKEIEHTLKPVCIIKGANELKSPAYRSINPMGKVPALQIDGHHLIESLSILHYLEETRPEPPLLPSDPYLRAKVREICEVIVSGIQPLQNVSLLEEFESHKRKEWAQNWILKGFKAVETLLNASAGKYCVGDSISMADCCLVPQVYNARKFEVDLQSFPTILKIDKALEAHPAFRATHPSRQPDCPPDMAAK